MVDVGGNEDHIRSLCFQITRAATLAICTAHICPRRTNSGSSEAEVCRTKIETVVEAVDISPCCSLRTPGGIARTFQNVLIVEAISDQFAVLIRADVGRHRILRTRLCSRQRLLVQGSIEHTVLAAVALMAIAYRRFPAPVGVG